MAAPIVHAVGTEAEGTGAISVAWPDHQADDIGILFVEHANQSVGTPSGWTSIAATGTGTAGVASSTGLIAFWKRATSSAEANVAVADTGVRQIGVIVVVRGCITSGSPVDTQVTSVQASANASVTFPAVTTTVAEALVVNALSNSLGIAATTVRPSTLTNAALQSLVKRANTQADGTGGQTTGLLPVGFMAFGGGGTSGDVGEGPDLTTGTPCRACMFVPNISTIGAQIDAADLGNILLILNCAGNKQSYTTTINGTPTLDMAKYESNLRRFRPDDDNTAFADRLKFADAVRRRRIILYVVDEPNLNTGTNPTVPNITPAETNQMALLHKAQWTGYEPLTLVRVPAETMASGWNGLARPTGGWTGIDYCWSQYTLRHGRGAANNQPWATPVSPTDLYNEQVQICTDNNLNMGVGVSLNLYRGGIGNDYSTVVARWDTDGAGGSSALNWVAGDNGPAVPGEVLTTLPTSQKAVIANPNFVRRFAQEMAAIPSVPFCLFWQHTAPGNASDEYINFYQRADFQSAFADAINAGLARSTFSGWRTAK